MIHLDGSVVVPFTYDYALVSLGDKIGLIDTNGREIIAPMSLENDTYNLVDSLTQAVERFKKKHITILTAIPLIIQKSLIYREYNGLNRHPTT